MLALVACALVLALTYPTREYFAQQAQITKLRQQTTEQQARVQRLSDQKTRWDDPAYVKAQARQRLHYVMPGETGLVAVGSGAGGVGMTGASGSAGRAASPPGGKAPWYSNLAASVAGAGADPAPSATRPARASGPAPTAGPITDTRSPHPYRHHRSRRSGLTREHG